MSPKTTTTSETPSAAAETAAPPAQLPEEGFKGNVLIQLIDKNGVVKDERRAGNLITDAGDAYYAAMAIALVTPAAPAQPTKMTGMKLGTGSTAVAKAGAGAALVTYITGSNNPFDAAFPVTQNLGAGLGVNGQYKTTWAAGDVTNAAITEAVIVNDAGTDATSTAANTSHRIVFAAINKTASDSLVITWNAKFLGAQTNNVDRSYNRLSNLELSSSSQPPGQRAEDKLRWAREIIALYEPVEHLI